MNAKITYLIGAGASANALPLIKKSSSKEILGLPDELKKFVTDFKNSELNTDRNVYDRLKMITDKCLEFGTPDLYAKFLLETGDDLNYKLLKKLLSNYFTFKQTIAAGNAGRQGVFDYRVLTFLTTITLKKIIPDNVKILSWNYDRQFEIGATMMKPKDSGGYDKVRGFTCWPNSKESNDGDSHIDNLFLLHLNGVAGYNYSERSGANEDSAVYNFETHQKETLISFAWEDSFNDTKHTFNEKRLSKALDIAIDTEILVVIGYSFPFFNRKIDDELIKAMKNKLKKIYYQDPNLNGIQLINQFGLHPSFQKNIVHISQTDNYHIPFEL